MDLKGRVALVTGGATGIGLACAKQLLQNGAHVAICDTDCQLGEETAKALTEEFGKDRAIFIKTDVAIANELEEAFMATKSHFKSLDIVVNNAGIVDDAHWEKEVDVNLKAVIRGTLLGFQHMGTGNGGNGGVIVNTASILGLLPAASAPIYAATKHAVVGLSQSLGLPFHFHRTGVSVVTLCPGVTNTAMFQHAHRGLLSSELEAEWFKELKSCPQEEPETVGRSFMRLLQVANSGSVWVSEGEDTYEISLPHYKSLKSQSLT